MFQWVWIPQDKGPPSFPRIVGLCRFLRLRHRTAVVNNTTVWHYIKCPIIFVVDGLMGWFYPLRSHIARCCILLHCSIDGESNLPNLRFPYLYYGLLPCPISMPSHTSFSVHSLPQSSSPLPLLFAPLSYPFYKFNPIVHAPTSLSIRLSAIQCKPRMASDLKVNWSFLLNAETVQAYTSWHLE